MTPGTHPAKVRSKTISTDPQPLSSTATGGQIIQSNVRKIPILSFQ